MNCNYSSSHELEISEEAAETAFANESMTRYVPIDKRDFEILYYPVRSLRVHHFPPFGSTSLINSEV